MLRERLVRAEERQGDFLAQQVAAGDERPGQPEAAAGEGDRVREFGSDRKETSLPEEALPTRSGRGPRPRAMPRVISLFLLLATKKILLKQLTPQDRIDHGLARSPRARRTPKSRSGQ